VVLLLSVEKVFRNFVYKTETFLIMEESYVEWVRYADKFSSGVDLSIYLMFALCL